MADHGVCHFSQWFPGKDNDAADILSQNHTMSDAHLSKYIKFLYSNQVSPTFLLYIRKQVNEFSTNVARKMIQNSVYHHVPDADREDPRTHNPMAATANIGMGASGASINCNVFSVWV
jgi:hypothetical protein